MSLNSVTGESPDDVRMPVQVVVDERLKTASLCLATGYGSRDDPEGGGGLAHMLEHILMSAPLDGGPSLSESLERLGGYANAETGIEGVRFVAQVLQEHLEDAVAALLEAVLRPRWDERILAQERGAVLRELASLEADPSEDVQDAFLRTLFPGHPLGRPVGGTVQEVTALSLATLDEVHRSRFLRAPRVLAVMTPRPPRLPEQVRTQAGPAAAAPGRESVPQALKPLTPHVPDTVAWPGGFCWVCVGGRSAPAGHADTEAFRVLAAMLGDSPSSLLYQKLRRDESLAYVFQTWHGGYRESGAWRTMIGLEPENGPAAVRAVLSSLEDLAAHGPSDATLEVAVRKSCTQMLQESEIPLEMVRMTARRSMETAGAWSLEEELASLRRVSADDVRRAAGAVLDTLQIAVSPGAA